jgi:hypothetical protein
MDSSESAAANSETPKHAFTLPLIQINMNDCNPDTTIDIQQATIQIVDNKAYIYMKTRNQLITTTTNRLGWLRQQYIRNQTTHHPLELPKHHTNI